MMMMYDYDDDDNDDDLINDYAAFTWSLLNYHLITIFIIVIIIIMNTKTGDTAVYLLFAFARLSSILRKAVDVRSIDLTKLLDVDNNYLTLGKRKNYCLLWLMMIMMIDSGNNRDHDMMTSMVNGDNDENENDDK